MQAAWVSLKENVNCVCKLTDVVSRAENYCRRKACDSRHESLEKELVHQLRNPFCEALFRPNYPKTQFHGKYLYRISFTHMFLLRLPIFSLSLRRFFCYLEKFIVGVRVSPKLNGNGQFVTFNCCKEKDSVFHSQDIIFFQYLSSSTTLLPAVQTSKEPGL